MPLTTGRLPQPCAALAYFTALVSMIPSGMPQTRKGEEGGVCSSLRRENIPKDSREAPCAEV